MGLGGKLFGKLSRAIIVAAQAGGGDPDANLTLRYAIDRARKASMPKDNIERAISLEPRRSFRVTRGLLLLLLKRYQDAEALFRAAHEEAPDAPGPRRTTAAELAATGPPEEQREAGP